MHWDMVELCKSACDNHASDLHLTVESPPILRIHGELVRLSSQRLSAKDTESLLMSICPSDRYERFRVAGQVDFSYSVAGTGRFRVNAFRQRGSAALTIRVLREEVPKLADLGLPQTVARFTSRCNGLVLVAGATGSGKSSTLAALVDQISTTMPCHVITLEDPIEFLHKHGKGLVNQREIGADTLTFADGVRAALREDPDVIVIGELRDLETASTALSAADTGHLVLATMHAPRAVNAITRLVDLFPAEYQRQARSQVSEALQGIVAQQLVSKMPGPGRAAACEVLVATDEVRDLIREGNVHRLHSVISQGAEGMITMEQSLQALWSAGIVSSDALKARS